MKLLGTHLSPLLGVLLLASYLSSGASDDSIRRKRQKVSVDPSELERFLIQDDEREMKRVRGHQTERKTKVGKGNTVWDHLFMSFETEAPTPSPPGRDTAAPTRVAGIITATPTVAPTNLLCAGISRSEAMLTLLSQVTDESLLQNPSTPQGVAYLWMLDGDPASIDPCTYATVEQRYGLATFFYSTGGDFWSFNTGWLSGMNECDWLGVNCEAGTAVVGLRLVENNLMGRIPLEIKALPRIREIDLQANNLQGLIPSTFRDLSQLTELNLEANLLVGNPFSTLIGATNLRRLRLSFNNFAGRLPDNLDSLDKLRELWIAGNLFRGTIPTVIGNIDSLESLLLYQNSFEGTIPAEIGNLRLFQFLAQFNQLTGPLPDTLWLNRDLDILRLDNNQFTGLVSQRIGDLANLRDLRLSNNTFTGDLPALLWRLNELEFLLLSGNEFSGQIRDSFAFWRRLDFVDFSENRFTGTIPGSLFDIPTIRIVYMSDNELEGPIPDNYGNAQLLKDLYLNNNMLTGQIPPIMMGEFTDLTELLLNGNNLTGTMPASICATRVPGGELEDLWSDCLGDIPEVECDCCSQCFVSA